MNIMNILCLTLNIDGKFTDDELEDLSLASPVDQIADIVRGIDFAGLIKQKLADEGINIKARKITVEVVE